MDIFKIKEEWDDGEFTFEYHDITSKTIIPLKTPKIELNISNNVTSQPEDKLLNKTPKFDGNIFNNKIVKAEKSQGVLKNLTITSVNNTDNIKITSNKQSLKTDGVQKKSVTVSSSNVNIVQNCQTQTQSHFKVVTNVSHNELPSSSYTRPVNSLPFNGATFLHTQVYSNSVLQSLLKDIVSLNNGKDDIDEDALNEEIARLRSKNNLPSLDASVSNSNCEFFDSDYSECSEDESSCYYDSKGSEPYGKDSGYSGDNESQYSEGLEDDHQSEIQGNLGNGAEKSPIITEPEFIDLDHYYGNKKRKLTALKGSLADIKPISGTTQLELALTNKIRPSSRQNRELSSSQGNKILKTKKLFQKLPDKDTMVKGVSRPEENLPEKKLIKCIGTCYFYGTKEELVQHVKEKHLKRRKINKKDESILLYTCKQCDETYFTNEQLKRHCNKVHKQKMACLFCSVICNNLTDYNLHVLSQHSQRAKKDSSSDSDGIEIIEIDEDR